MDIKEHSKKEKNCSFVGHRNVEKTEQLRETLINTIRWLITEKGVNQFFFGSKSNFDDLCQEIVKELKGQYPHIRRVYFRICYPEIDKKYMRYILQDFEDSCFPKCVENAGIARYVKRNQEMVDMSDFCIFYYNENYKPPLRKQSRRAISSYQPKSGTMLAYQYALQKKKEIINLYDGKFGLEK